MREAHLGRTKPGADRLMYSSTGSTKFRQLVLQLVRELTLVHDMFDPDVNDRGRMLNFAFHFLSSFS